MNDIDNDASAEAKPGQGPNDIRVVVEHQATFELEANMWRKEREMERIKKNIYKWTLISIVLFDIFIITAVTPFFVSGTLVLFRLLTVGFFAGIVMICSGIWDN